MLETSALSDIHARLELLGQKTLHAWSMAFIHVILVHMIVGNNLNQYISSIYIDCHISGCKLLETIRW